MHQLAFFAVMLCTACIVQQPPPRYAAAPPPPPPPQVAPPQVAPSPAAANQQCREFQTPVVIGGREQQAYGTACLQPDGTWSVTQSVGNERPQNYTVPPQVYQAYYPQTYAVDPWYYGPPLFVGGVFVGGGWGFHHHHGGWHGSWHGPWHH